MEQRKCNKHNQVNQKCDFGPVVHFLDLPDDFVRAVVSIIDLQFHDFHLEHEVNKEEAECVDAILHGIIHNFVKHFLYQC